jgi:aryl-alcohol dehydrogenase-like predicted oxidoreductase
MSAAPRWDPARNAYGPTSGLRDQRDAMEVSLAAGVNFFDTAALYGRGASERRLGELVGGRDVVIATKFPARFLSRDTSLPEALDDSLRRLGRPVIDLYQVHYPSRWMSIPKLMNLMADSVEAGKVRAVGVGNYSADQLCAAHAVLARRGIPLASQQVQYSLLHRDPETDGVLQVCRELGITLIAYMPLASGALTGKYSAENRPAGWRRYSPMFRGKGLARLEHVSPVLHDIASRHGRKPSQVALRWLIQQPGVLPIPGAKSGRQAEINVGALAFELDDEDVARLDEASRIRSSVR